MTPMIDLEHIRGDRIKKVFADLKRSKTLLKMRLVGKNFERLTLVTGTRKRFNKQYFLLDIPNGFQEAAGNKEEWRITYAFTGKDQIQYTFTSTGGEVYRNQLCIRFPEVINRNQRRKNFRLEAPEGTVVKILIAGQEFQEKVFDVSLGGALIALRCLADECQGELPFQVGDFIEDLRLILPDDPAEIQIDIKKAEVMRLDDTDPMAKTCCGLKFIEIDKHQAEVLTQYIYQSQRQFLKNRLRVDV